MDRTRSTICECCPAFRRGQVHAETWCARFDDRPLAAKNCEGARHARWLLRLASERPAPWHCRQWAYPADCASCRAAENDPIPEPERYRTCPPPEGWLSDPQVVARHLDAWREMAARVFSPPDDLAGDGIVTYGDGRVWPALVVGAKLLRLAGSTLPLQIWHVGAVGRELDEDPYTVLIDADCFAERHPARKLDSWARKSWIIAHSGFARVLFLDPDAYCVLDPGPLFALLDEHVFLYWSNLPWYHVNMDYELVAPLVGDKTWAPSVQGGHYLVDCRAAWKEIMLQRWWDDHADFWWRRCANNDEDGWRLTLTALGSNYREIQPADWEGCAFVCRDAGQGYIVHRCQGKFWSAGADRTNPALPREAEALELLGQVCPAAAGPLAAGSFSARKHLVRKERRKLFARATEK